VNLGLPVNEIQFTTGKLGEQERGIGMSCSNNAINLPPTPQSILDSGSDSFDRSYSFQQSVDLVGQVFQYTKSFYNGRILDSEGFKSLDEQLQSLLGQSLRNSFHSWEESCESIGMMFG